MSKTITLVTALIILTGCFDYSDGDRAGQVTKLSKKGFFCKTWEGEMNLGGMKNVTKSGTTSDGKSYSYDTMAANTFPFTIEDEKLVPVVMKALEEGQRVKVHYTQELFTFCRSDSNYFVDSVSFY